MTAKTNARKVALVLCGGGSRGALELGFYRALVELGVPIDLIVGSSVGALNGAFIAAGESADRMSVLWRSIRFRDLFGLNWRALLSPRRRQHLWQFQVEAFYRALFASKAI